jgi:plasmid stability protein
MIAALLLGRVQDSAYRQASCTVLFLTLFEEISSQYMANRKGVFIGAYVPNELKESLRRRAAAEHRTLSQEITRILVEAVHGKGLPSGSVDRRDNTTIPRRRATDPPIRRRAEDLPYIPPDPDKK